MEAGVAIRRELPPLPPKMRGLRLSDKGWPVPFFCPWTAEKDGGEETPDGEGYAQLHMMSERKLVICLKEHRCWLCGGQLGRFSSYVVGPMCLVNMTSAEPPSHRECAEYAVIACPFLTRPHQRRTKKEVEGAANPAGVMIERNPGTTVLLTSNKPPSLMGDGSGKVLIRIPQPTEVSIWFEGRPATAAEFQESIETGIGALYDACETDVEREEVKRLTLRVQRLYTPSE